jgi:PAT family beta-lactamase induction signal transducer AmpG
MDKFKKLISDRRMFIVFMMGFSSGLPLLLTGSTLQAWCKEGGMDLTQIGLFALVGIPYTLKFIWSPMLDWIVPPFFGRRRGWLLISQLGLVVALIALAFSDPHQGSFGIAICAVMVAFLSATQDIGIDAYQLEILPTESYGLGNQIYILGYRLGMLLAGGGSLILADMMSWRNVYFLMAAAMGVGIVTTLFAPEPKLAAAPPKSMAEAVVEPLKDFFSTKGSLKGKAFWILGFFLLYKVGSDMATALTTPYYLELGFTKTQIGTVVKVFGLWATITGGLIGGAAVMYMGIRRSLWVFGVIQGLANLSFAWLGHFVAATGTASVAALATAVSIENLAAGLGTAAYATFMGSLVNKRFTATQYALLSSLMGMTRVFGAAPTGWLASHMGWSAFFIFCSAASLPGLLLLFKVRDFTAPPEISTKVSMSIDAFEAAPAARVLFAGADFPVAEAVKHKQAGL